MVQLKDENVSNTKKKELSEKTASFKEGVQAYLKGVKSEWGKITWPERNQIVRETLVVLFVVVVFTILVLVLDLVFRDFVFSWLK
jgi:preprotein translocase subunit SecE